MEGSSNLGSPLEERVVVRRVHAGAGVEELVAGGPLANDVHLIPEGPLIGAELRWRVNLVTNVRSEEQAMFLATSV
jgi:hypothetical protein